MSNNKSVLSPNLARYVRQVGVRETELMQELRKVTAELPNAKMQITPEHGQLLALFVELIRAKRVLEVGTFTGYSALAMAQVLPDDGKLVACDVNAEWTQVAQQFWQRAGVADKIDLRLAPAIATLDQLIEQGYAGSFDLVFIDADKRPYDQYYERSLVLLRQGGLVVLDNMLQHGEVADAAVNRPNVCAIRALNEKLQRDQRITVCMLPVDDGITLAVKH